MAFKQKKYLSNTPLAEALHIYNEALKSSGIGNPLPGERVDISDALGRVTSEAVIATISSPFYHSAAMDGYAVKFIDTFGAAETRPKRLAVPSQAVAVDTGDPMPDGFDGVIMIEDVEKVPEGIEILEGCHALAARPARGRGHRRDGAHHLGEPCHQAGRHGGHDRERSQNGHGEETTEDSGHSHGHRAGRAGERSQTGRYHRFQLNHAVGNGNRVWRSGGKEKDR